LVRDADWKPSFNGDVGLTMLSLDGLQQLRVLVAHPRDLDGEAIIRHLQRIGCQVEGMWPPPADIPKHIDVVYYWIDEQTRHSLPWFVNQPHTAVVAIVENETPNILEFLVDSCPQAVVTKPAEPFGVLTSLILAHSIFRYEERLNSKVRKLEETIRTVRKVEQAKTILMKSKNIQEKEAYEYLRKHAMNQRVPIGRVASAVIEANDVLN
jgi:AmiR/NasT family two-component response regulator